MEAGLIPGPEAPETSVIQCSTDEPVFVAVKLNILLSPVDNVALKEPGVISIAGGREIVAFTGRVNKPSSGSFVEKVIAALMTPAAVGTMVTVSGTFCPGVSVADEREGVTLLSFA